MKPGLQYRLITLMVAVVIAAISFAVMFLPSSLERQLHHDLNIPEGASVSIIDHPTSLRVVAVKRVDSTYTLFAAFNDRSVDGSLNGWYIPIVVGSGAPPGIPEFDLEYSRDFDHPPSQREIKAFRDEFGLN